MLALDGTVSPYLPTKEVLAALEASSDAEMAPATLARALRERLALLHGVARDRIALFPHDDHRLDAIGSLHSETDWVLFSPGAEPLGIATVPAPVLRIDRCQRFRIGAEQIGATPEDAIALIMTPNDPVGTALAPTVVAQLAGRVALLVIDDRSAEIRRRSMLPLVEEFGSIVLLRSFSDWAGLDAQAPGYAIGTNRIAAAIDRSELVPITGLRAALAAVSNAPQLDAIAQRVRLERMRLYRMLRKLNFLAPFPSDAGYVLADVRRGDRDVIAQALANREIAVHSPREPRLKNTLRFTAISPAATRTLQSALIDIGRTVIDSTSTELTSPGNAQ